jgi:hypothetical protein
VTISGVEIFKTLYIRNNETGIWWRADVSKVHNLGVLLLMNLFTIELSSMRANCRIAYFHDFGRSDVHFGTPTSKDAKRIYNGR